MCYRKLQEVTVKQVVIKHSNTLKLTSVFFSVFFFLEKFKPHSLTNLKRLCFFFRCRKKIQRFYSFTQICQNSHKNQLFQENKNYTLPWVDPFILKIKYFTFLTFNFQTPLRLDGLIQVWWVGWLVAGQVDQLVERVFGQQLRISICFDQFPKKL